MGYSGKPSPSCERCRARRLRCDLARPSCASCVRAKVQCIGYRDQADLTFRDQSHAVVRRYNGTGGKRRSKANPSSQTTASPRSVDDDRTSVSETASMSSLDQAMSSPCLYASRIVTPEVQDLARGYFYANYLSGDTRARHMSYLVPIVQHGKDHALDAALNAVALATFANIHSSPVTAVKAHAEYAAALSETNRALQDPTLCKSNDTIAAVMLLGMFEIVACTDGHFIHRWVNHLHGATRLLEVRGTEQLSTPFGRQIFRQLRPQMILGSLCQAKAAAPILDQLTREIEEDPESDQSILDELARIGLRMTRLTSSISDRILVSPKDIIREALRIDADAVSILFGAREPWTYQTLEAPKLTGLGGMASLAAWGDSYHIYDSIDACIMWNNYRSIRIIIQVLIRETIAQNDDTSKSDPRSSHNESLETQSRQIIEQMAQDICASVPFCLGCEVPSEAGGGCSSSRERVAPLGSQVNGSGGFTLMWPLLVAANSGIASEELRLWIVGCLDKIGHSMGINQALAMSGALRKGLTVDDWVSPSRESTLTVV